MKPNAILLAILLCTTGLAALAAPDSSRLGFAAQSGTSIGWRFETIKSPFWDGETSIALDPDQQPVVAVAPAIGQINLARRSVASWTMETVDSGLPVAGGGVDLGIDRFGVSHLMYDGGPFPHCVWYSRSSPIGWSKIGVDSGFCGLVSVADIAVDTSGLPHALYMRQDPSSIVVVYAELTGSAWTHEIVGNGAEIGWTSLVLDEAGRPHLLFYGANDGEVRYATRNTSGSWQLELVDTVGSIQYVGRHGSIVLDGAGTPHAFYLADVKFGENRAELRHAVRGPSGWVVETLPGAPGMRGFYPKGAWSRSAGLQVVYQTWGSVAADLDLYRAVLTGNGWNTELLYDSVSGVRWPSFTLDRCGNPHVSFYLYDNSGLMYATRGEPCPPAAAQPADLKHDAIAHIEALKEQSLARGDKRFLHELDEAEKHVWRSLGFTDSFQPVFVAALPFPDVTARSRDHDKVQLALGPSWDPKLASYRSLRLTWSNGVVTVVDLPRGWLAKDLEFHTTPWVDAWHQDILIHMERDDRRVVTLDIQAHQANMGFTVSLDADRVAGLSFTYAMRHLWVDATHLDPKQGGKVFEEEEKAVKETVCVGDGDDGHEHGGCGEDDHEHDDKDDDSAATVRCRLDPRKWNDSERAALDKECVAIANLLVKADEMLALVALQDAKDTPIRDPHHAKEVQHEIDKAERELKKASSEWDEREYDDAIDHFKHAWDHARHAVEQATR